MGAAARCPADARCLRPAGAGVGCYRPSRRGGVRAQPERCGAAGSSAPVSAHGSPGRGRRGHASTGGHTRRRCGRGRHHSEAGKGTAGGHRARWRFGTGHRGSPHEALIRRWQRLRDWIDADREFLRTRGVSPLRRSYGRLRAAHPTGCCLQAGRWRKAKTCCRRGGPIWNRCLSHSSRQPRRRRVPTKDDVGGTLARSWSRWRS